MAAQHPTHIRQCWARDSGHELKSFLVIAAVILLYSSFRDYFLLDRATVLNGYGMALAGLIAIAGLGVRYPQSAPGVTLLVRSISVILTSYLILQKAQGLSPLQSEVLENQNVAFLISWAEFIGIAAGLIGLWRPSSVFFCLCIVQWQKIAHGLIGGYYLTWIDYLALVEVGQFLVLCLIIGMWLGLLESKRPPGTDNTAIRFPQIALLIAVSIHFANYFWSAVAKLVLAGGWTSWVIENPTHSLILTAHEGGFSPLSIVDWLPGWLWSTLNGPGAVALNVAVLFTQAVSLVAIANRRSIILLTLIYDAQHIAIFLLTGIFFWKWILLNFAIVAAVSLLRSNTFPPLTTAACICMVVIAPYFFTIARLGWYDSYSFNNLKVYALLKNGESVRIPSNYFLEYSVLFAQQYPGRPYNGHFATLTYGATVDYDVFVKANNCGLPITEETIGSSSGMAKAESLIRAHHERVLRLAKDRVSFNYDFYPHHIWSNPFLFDAAARLNPVDVVGYRVSVSSVCFVNSSSGHERKVKKVTSHDIKL